MRRLWILAIFALVLAACGGGEADPTNDTETPGTTAQGAPATTQGNDSSSATTEAPSDGGGSSGGVSTGTVTIGNETYEYEDTGFPGLRCDPDAFGVAFLAALQSSEGAVDGKIGSLVVGIPFKGEEATAGILPELSASVGDLDWQANEARAAERDIPAGSSQVDSYEIDGNTISGTATFYEENSSFSGGDLVVEKGTFEVTCVEG